MKCETATAPTSFEPILGAMKRNLTAFAIVLLVMGMGVRASSGAVDISINIGDRPYYYGPTYWESGYEFIWVPGFTEHGHWAHGHYKRHGEFRREHANEHRPKGKH
jgi:hypothetical protein